MVDVRGDVLRPPHGTTPAAVKLNIESEMRSRPKVTNFQWATLCTDAREYCDNKQPSEKS